MKRHSRNFLSFGDNHQFQHSKTGNFNTMTNARSHQRNYSQMTQDTIYQKDNNYNTTTVEPKIFHSESSTDKASRSSDVRNLSLKITKIEKIVNEMFQEDNQVKKNKMYEIRMQQIKPSQNQQSKKSKHFQNNYLLKNQLDISLKDSKNDKKSYQSTLQAKIIQSKLNVFSRFQMKDSPKEQFQSQLDNITLVQNQLSNQSSQKQNHQNYYRKFSLNNHFVREKYLGLRQSRHLQKYQNKTQNNEEVKEKSCDYQLKNGKSLNEQLKRIQQKMEKLSIDKKKVFEGAYNKSNNAPSGKENTNNAMKIQKLIPKTQTMENLYVRNVFSPINNNSSKISLNQINKENKISKNQIIEALSTQFRLDQEFRRAKKWFFETKTAMKWQFLAETLARKGVKLNQKQLKEIFNCQDEEKDPFYSSRQDDETIKSLVQKFLSAQRHWMRKIYHQHNKLKEQGLSEQNFDHHKKGYITIEDLVRFINLKTRGMYSTRDAYLVFNRLKKGPKLTYKDLLTEFSNQNSN